MPPAARGRPRTFDPAVALEKATGVFLRKGYDATSLDDLTAAMGINRPSLYAAFGNKADLYAAALKHYATQGTAQVLGALDGDDVIEGAQNMLRALAKKMSGGCEGCLVTASAIQCGRAADAADPLIEDATRAVVAQIVAGLEKAFSRARTRGTLNDTIPPRALAHYIGGLTQGITTYARTSGDPKATLAMAETACVFLESLRATPTRR